MNWQLLDTLLTRLRPHREALALLLDIVVVAIAWQATYLFRLGFERWFAARPDYDGWVLLGLLAIYAGVLWMLRVPKGMWRFSGFGEVKRLAAACLLAGLIAATAVLMAHLRAVPRAVLTLHPLFTLMLLAMMRMGYRMLYEHMRSRISGTAQEQRRALVMGAGDAGRLLVAGIQHSQGWVVVGFLDDDPAKQGGRVAGLPVLGDLTRMGRFAELHGVTHLIVAMPAASAAQRRRALDVAGATGLPVLTVPSSTELLAGRRVNEVRDIEPEDLLGRPPVQLDEAGIWESVNATTVMVTGAGGSIGSELCRQIARYGPRSIVLYELSEYALYAVEQALTESFPHLPLIRVIGDVKDLPHLRDCFERYRPQLVFHAAAFKHVPLMEEADNTAACIRNNTLGTYNAALVAAETAAERFVLISTDKAVNPTNVMGATKRAAEMALAALAKQHPGTRFMAVRFGNVLGSSGSVIPKFKEQIARGGPLTVTHPDIIRYFMTIPEAARLVIQAAAIGESGQVLVLDMGEPVRIADLARQMIRMSGHSTDAIRIEYTGLRPGEKLYEELLADHETSLPTTCAGVRVARLIDDGAGERVLSDLATLDASQPRRCCMSGWAPNSTLPLRNPEDAATFLLFVAFRTAAAAVLGQLPAAVAFDLVPAKTTREVDFVLPAKPSKMLRAPLLTWQPLLSQAAEVLDDRVKQAESLDKGELVELHIQRTLLAQTRRDWRQTLDAVGRARAAQDNEASRQTSGLLNEVLARRALKSGDKAWVRKQLRDQVLAMPWGEVEATIRSFRAQLAEVKAETVETYVVNRLDRPAVIAKNQVSMGFLFQLLGARFQLLEVMPYRDALVAGLDDAIAQRGQPASK